MRMCVSEWVGGDAYECVTGGSSAGGVSLGHPHLGTTNSKLHIHTQTDTHSHGQEHCESSCLGPPPQSTDREKENKEMKIKDGK